MLGSGCPQLKDGEFHTDPALAGAGGDGSRGIDGGSLPHHANPRVIASRPAMGERGVLRDASIQLTFSEPMDADATEAAYRSSDLPASSVEFSWSSDRRLLVITPREPLVYASSGAAAGPGPAPGPGMVTARTYSLSLSADAHDAAGLPLEPFALSFSTAREIALTLPAKPEPTLTGKYRSDETDGVGECATAQQTVCAGVGATAGNPSYRGFLTFDLGMLPPDRLGLSRAELSLTISVVYGTPFATLGALLLESVRFDTIGLEAFDAAARAPAASFDISGALDESASLDVLAAVQADVAEGKRSQFRLRFAESTIDDAGPDLFAANLPTLQLRVAYLKP